ncbi:MAG: AhpC/TSA family protein [Chitinophagaceae bacterium]|nr:MAG: AhpC/TSA family protein [Chitinophagaceae bacterium]
MKKKFVLVVILTFLLSFVYAQLSFKIEGDLTAFKKPSRLFINYNNGTNGITDSVVLKNGKFVFKGKINRPQFAVLTVYPLLGDGPETMAWQQKMTLDNCTFYIDKGVVSIKGRNLATAVIKGGSTQKEYQRLQDQLAGFNREMKLYQEQLPALRARKDEKAEKEVFSKIREIRVKMNQIEEDFIPDHLDSYVTYDMINQKAVVINPDTFEPIFNKLSERLRTSDEGKALQERINIAKRTNIGKTIMDFTQNDVNGKPFTLSSLKGKYILLDFWASWCGPCRSESPFILDVYNKYKNKNFEVVAVSLDDDRDKWVKAIAQDGMPWIQLSDLAGVKNKVAVQYGVRAIPQNFLISPDGIIVAKDLRGEEIEKKLTELIPN